MADKENKCVAECRKCKGDHWTYMCRLDNKVLERNLHCQTQNNSILYRPLAMRNCLRHGNSMQMQSRNDTTAIRISNLPESTTDGDLEELVREFGAIQKLYLAKEKNTNVCKGFAYVHYKMRADAARAIETLNGYGYDHLILSVDWSKPPA